MEMKVKKMFLEFPKKDLVKTLPRKGDKPDIRQVFEFLINLGKQDWVKKIKEDENGIHIILKEEYNVEGAIMLWNYYLKH